MVQTRGKAGASLEVEREQIETTLRQSYEDRLQELEEQRMAQEEYKEAHTAARAAMRLEKLLEKSIAYSSFLADKIKKEGDGVVDVAHLRVCGRV